MKVQKETETKYFVEVTMWDILKFIGLESKDWAINNIKYSRLRIDPGDLGTPIYRIYLDKDPIYKPL